MKLQPSDHNCWTVRLSLRRSSDRQSPAEPICARRAAELFGYGWEDYFLDSDSGGEKSAARKGIQAKAMDRKAFEAKKEFIEASQTKLMESVLERLTLIGRESKRNTLPIYAASATGRPGGLAVSS